MTLQTDCRKHSASKWVSFHDYNCRKTLGQFSTKGEDVDVRKGQLKIQNWNWRNYSADGKWKMNWPDSQLGTKGLRRWLPASSKCHIIVTFSITSYAVQSDSFLTPTLYKSRLTNLPYICDMSTQSCVMNRMIFCVSTVFVILSCLARISNTEGVKFHLDRKRLRLFIWYFVLLT